MFSGSISCFLVVNSLFCFDYCTCIAFGLYKMFYFGTFCALDFKLCLGLAQMDAG